MNKKGFWAVHAEACLRQGRKGAFLPPVGGKTGKILAVAPKNGRLTEKRGCQALLPRVLQVSHNFCKIILALSSITYKLNEPGTTNPSATFESELPKPKRNRK
jgi:hypothetical protein